MAPAWHHCKALHVKSVLRVRNGAALLLQFVETHTVEMLPDKSLDAGKAYNNAC